MLFLYILYIIDWMADRSVNFNIFAEKQLRMCKVWKPDHSANAMLILVLLSLVVKKATMMDESSIFFPFFCWVSESPHGLAALANTLIISV